MRNWNELKTMAGMSENSDNYDVNWLKQMIRHHQGALKMAKEAKGKAEHQELKDLADAIITSQSAEIEKMKGWIKDWGK